MVKAMLDDITLWMSVTLRVVVTEFQLAKAHQSSSYVDVFCFIR